MTAAQKFLAESAGQITEVSAMKTSAGAGDAGKIPALDDTGKLDSSMMPVGIGSEADVIPASEDLAAGDFVNVWTSTGAVKVRKADATTAGKEANGFVLSSVTTGNNATVYRPSQLNTQLTGLTPGTLYYLSATAGQATATAPQAAGNVVQRLGRAKSATELMFAPGDPVVKA